MNSLVITLIVSVCLFETISPEKVTKTGDCKWTTSETGITLDLSGFKNYLEYHDQPTFYYYRYYPCKIETNWDDTYCTVSTDTALCQTDNFDYRMVGTLASVDVKVLTSLASDTSFELLYSRGDESRTGSVTITCDQSSDFFKFDYESYPNYFFSFSVKSACTRAQGGNPPAFFLILLIVLLIAAPTYVVAGVLIMYFYKKARGVELIPNIEFWKDIPFLLKDGFLFTFSCYPPFREWIGNRPGMETKGGTYETVK